MIAWAGKGLVAAVHPECRSGIPARGCQSAPAAGWIRRQGANPNITMGARAVRYTGVAVALCVITSATFAARSQAVPIDHHALSTAASAAPPASPPAPAADDERPAGLFAAIVRGDPASATAFFLPRDAFAQIKATNHPDVIYDRLLRAYERDVRALHATTSELERAQFVRVELSRRRAWVVRGEEANRVPYWAQRHNALVYRVGDAERRIDLRVLIAWQGRWYVTHLSEFKLGVKAPR
jgi:hypothetical protein